MLGFIYSLASYAGFLAAFTYFAWFSDGVGVPRHVDTGASTDATLALFINVGLIVFLACSIRSWPARASNGC